MHFFTLDKLPVTKMLPGVARRAVWLDGVMLTFFTFEPRAIVPEHEHPHEQITVVTKGTIQFTLDGETRLLQVGEGVCIPPDTPHSAVVLDDAAEAIDAWNPPRDDYKA